MLIDIFCKFALNKGLLTKIYCEMFLLRASENLESNFMYHTDHSAFYMIKVHFLKTDLQLQAIKQKQSFSDQ